MNMVAHASFNLVAVVAIARQPWRRSSTDRRA